MHNCKILGEGSIEDSLVADDDSPVDATGFFGPPAAVGREGP